MTALAVREENTSVANFDSENIDLLKDTICKGCTTQEFQLFVNICQRTGLDPFMKQIYPVKRWDSKLGREVMTVQTSIDGYRLIAERTGQYVPGREPTYEYDKDGSLVKATAYVMKYKQGSWHEIPAHAFFNEYCQTFKDKKTGEIKATQFWVNMKHAMLAKCAESLALRKAFPAELCQIYTREEMQQSEVEEIVLEKPSQKSVSNASITSHQALEIHSLLSECDPLYRAEVHNAIKRLKFDCIENLTPEMYIKVKAAAERKRAEYQHNKNMVVTDVQDGMESVQEEEAHEFSRA